MIFKWLKRGVIMGAVVLLAGGLVLGTDVVSYIRSSAKTVRTSVKDSIPTAFELQRARDLLDDIIPDMQANIRLIAEEEVEIAALDADIPASQQRLAWERDKIEKLSGMLAVEQASYEIGGRHFDRQEIKGDLARRFDRFKEAEVVLAGKHRLLKARQKSLRGAMQILERTRSQKALLEEQVAGLEAQNRLIRASAVGTHLRLDDTKLAQAEKLIRQIRKRLNVAERILAHEARFTDPIPTETIGEQELLAQVREHLAGPDKLALAAAPDAPAQQSQRQN